MTNLAKSFQGYKRFINHAQLSLFSDVRQIFAKVRGEENQPPRGPGRPPVYTIGNLIAKRVQAQPSYRQPNWKPSGPVFKIEKHEKREYVWHLQVDPYVHQTQEWEIVPYDGRFGELTKEMSSESSNQTKNSKNSTELSNDSIPRIISNES